MAHIQIENVFKNYAKTEVVKGVSLTVNDGEFMVLVGPSGCGKSTLLRMIAGLEDIDKGTIAIDGKVINNIPPKNRDLAMVFQNYALYPHMSVYENLAFGLKINGVKKKDYDPIIQETAKILGLTELLERKPKQLSGGQKQRIAVGRAIVRNPKAFLFDEPLSNLDAKLRIQMRTDLLRLHKQQKATSISDENGRFFFLTNSGKKFIELPESVFSKVSDISSKKLILGIRPEDILTAPSTSENTYIETLSHSTIELIEHMGDVSLLHINSDAKVNWTVKTPPQSDLKVGDEKSLYLNLSKIHLFDQETEVNLTL